MKLKTVINPITRKEMEASFQYGEYMFYFDKSELDESKSTVAERTSDGEIISGKEANELLAENVDAYCQESGKVWIAPEFRSVVKSRQASH